MPHAFVCDLALFFATETWHFSRKSCGIKGSKAEGRRANRFHMLWIFQWVLLIAAESKRSGVVRCCWIHRLRLFFWTRAPDNNSWTWLQGSWHPKRHLDWLTNGLLRHQVTALSKNLYLQKSVFWGKCSPSFTKCTWPCRILFAFSLSGVRSA